ncbi:aldo/keto reductase [Cohnella sp. CFH 77786]|nr:aldo/keto reductase [Cohnella sp. CFH 77786]
MDAKLPLNRHGFEASRLVLGCMGFGGGWTRDPLTAEHLKQMHEGMDAALSVGINMVDHANIYAFGKAEQVFGQMLKERPGLRDQLVIQSKCGIRWAEREGESNRFDFSKSHILESVDGILSRLGIESLDILLLHRPDPLIEPEEVAEAFEALRSSGKVKRFGVSNMSAGQMRYLQAFLDEPIVANQLELSLTKLDWLDSQVHVNQEAGKLSSFPDGTLEYCRLNHVQIQAWSPLRGLFNVDLGQAEPRVRATDELVGSMAEERGVSKEAIALSFLLRHPARIQPVLGTSRPERIRACAEAMQVELSREEWYKLYVTSRGRPMP